MRATKLAFEKRYSDDSDVKSAVRLDGEVIQFESDGSTIEFDASELTWLQDALGRIEIELEADQVGN